MSAQAERVRWVAGLSARIGDIHREVNRPDVCTETVRRVTGLSAQKGDVHRKGNRTDIVFPQEKVVYVVHS